MRIQIKYFLAICLLIVTLTSAKPSNAQVSCQKAVNNANSLYQNEQFTDAIDQYAICEANDFINGDIFTHINTYSTAMRSSTIVFKSYIVKI